MQLDEVLEHFHTHAMTVYTYFEFLTERLQRGTSSDGFIIVPFPFIIPLRDSLVSYSSYFSFRFMRYLNSIPGRILLLAPGFPANQASGRIYLAAANG